MPIKLVVVVVVVGSLPKHLGVRKPSPKGFNVFLLIRIKVLVLC